MVVIKGQKTLDTKHFNKLMRGVQENMITGYSQGFAADVHTLAPLRKVRTGHGLSSQRAPSGPHTHRAPLCAVWWRLPDAVVSAGALANATGCRLAAVRSDAGPVSGVS